MSMVVDGGGSQMRSRNFAWARWVGGGLLLCACSSGSPDQTGFVGAQGGSGGTRSTASGGAPGSGGATNAGGQSGSTGGGQGGQVVTDASSGSGGSAGSDGSAAGGAGTSGDSGAASPDGSGEAGTGTTASAGCGKAPPTPVGMVGTTQFGKFSLLPVTGQSYISYSQPPTALNRLYYVRRPANYDPNRPYRVIYVGPGCGPAQDTITNTKGLPIDGVTGAADNAIFVQMEQGSYNPALYNPANCRPGNTSGCNASSAYCFDDWAYVPANTIPDSTTSVAVERAYFDALHKAIEADYCVDRTRQFFAGYSSGGWLAQQLGCWFPDVLRAQANVTGGLPPNIQTNTTGANNYCVDHPIAAFLIHDALDASNFFSGSVDAAARLFRLNRCTGTFVTPPRPDSTAQLPSGLALYSVTGAPNGTNFRCYQYTTCPATAPIVFCVSLDGMHNDQQNRADPAFWEFFTSSRF
jgi:hypothetical protein